MRLDRAQEKPETVYLHCLGKLLYRLVWNMKGLRRIYHEFDERIDK